MNKKFKYTYLAVILAVLVAFVSGCTPSVTDQSSILNDSSLVSSVIDNSSSVVSGSSSEENVASDTTNSGSSDTTSKPESTNNLSSSEGTVSKTDSKVNPAKIPAYSGEPFVVINDNIPSFSSAELKTVGYEKYLGLDKLGRTQMAIASVGRDTMPKPGEERGSISSIKPSGWIQAQYDCISGKYLYNRCHLIGWQLSAENANKGNLLTGTKYLNIEGMLPFENMVADYIKETNNHVAYRITPIYIGNNLLASGVQMEAYSVEDNGDGICFNVYCYNVQPDVKINYATGSSSGKNSATGTASSSKPSSSVSSSSSKPAASSSSTPSTNPSVNTSVWVSKTGSKYHSKASCSNMKNPSQITKSEAESRNLTPCSKCW